MVKDGRSIDFYNFRANMFGLDLPTTPAVLPNLPYCMLKVVSLLGKWVQDLDDSEQVSESDFWKVKICFFYYS